MNSNSRLDILVFAAGTSSRMRGLDKLMLSIEGQPLLVRVVREALATGNPVTVLLSPDRPAREQALFGLAVRKVIVFDAALGMSASIQAGIAALPMDAVGAMFLMADMPDLRAEDLTRLIEAFVTADCNRVVRATSEDGTPGSPSIVPKRLFAAFKGLSGDQGGRAAMQDETPLLVPLPGRRALTDLDTPEDWAKWRALIAPPE